MIIYAQSDLFYRDPTIIYENTKEIDFGLFLVITYNRLYKNI